MTPRVRTTVGTVMQVDPTTLSDLEVFQEGDGGPGLFALIDETETQKGRKALRDHLRFPSSDLGEIRRTQEAVRFLAGLSSLPRIDREAVEGVERYLASNIQVPAATGPIHAFAEAIWLSVRYRDLFREMRAGVQATRAVLLNVERLARQVLAERPPPRAEESAREMIEICHVLSHHAAARSRGDVVRADHALRGPERVKLIRVIDLLAELDALRSMARATARLNWTFPELVDGEAFLLEGEDVWHPFIEGPVRNPIGLTRKEPVVFLTGPNMAGKTTYLRSAALAVLLAQTGMGVPARRLRLTPVEALITSLNPSDNLRAGMSYFLSEVLRVQVAAETLAEGRRAFVLFDEVFKGTNVSDALEASAEVISGFSLAARSGFIFSSHIVELEGKLRSNPRVRFEYFEGRLVEGRAEYSYRLHSGISNLRLGLQLLREAGIPQLIARIGAEGGAGTSPSAD
jgi:DNA mismatch repair ATPase MutS